MIKLEFPKVNLDAYPSAEEKIKVLKGQVDTLISELYIILDSIESGADSLLERQTNSDGTVSFYPMDINADKTAVSFFEKAPTDDEGVFAPPMDTTELNDFIDSLNRDFRGSVDWIVEEGTSGIWYYEKWASGIVKMWGVEAKTVVAGWSANNSLPVAYPFPLTQFIHGNVAETSYRIDRAYLNTNSGTDIQLNVHSGIDGTFTFEYYIVGRWK